MEKTPEESKKAAGQKQPEIKKQATVQAEEKPVKDGIPAETAEKSKRKTAGKAKTEKKADVLPEKTAKKSIKEVGNAPKAAKDKTPAEHAHTKNTSNIKKVLFVASEAFPFAGTGGLGEVMGSLPAAINKTGKAEARVILPLYDTLSKEVRESLEFVTHITVPLSWRNQYCGLFKIKSGGTVYYFVDNEYYFKRGGIYGYYDDGERFAFFSKAVLELLPYLDFMPDVLHCNDWHTALVPIYYKLFYQYGKETGGIKTVFTIHNIEYQGDFDRYVLGDLFGIPDAQFDSLAHLGRVNLLKGAIDYSDAVTTVSPAYAEELKNDFYAHGLAFDIAKQSYKICGILNGIDTVSYNPADDKALFKPYSAENLSGKAEDKKALQNLLGMPVDANVPIIAMVSRLVRHKGLELIKQSFDEIMSLGVQFVVLGTGDKEYENFFKYKDEAYRGAVKALITFNSDLARKIYSAADMFLMPSKSEPCGLSQMIALRYGTVPIVRATGGLKDSVSDCGDGSGGNGFVFDGFSETEFMNAVRRAAGLYRDYRAKWDGLVLRALKSDFSWDRSAAQYADFYSKL